MLGPSYVEAVDRMLSGELLASGDVGWVFETSHGRRLVQEHLEGRSREAAGAAVLALHLPVHAFDVPMGTVFVLPRLGVRLSLHQHEEDATLVVNLSLPEAADDEVGGLLAAVRGD